MAFRLYICGVETPGQKYFSFRQLTSFALLATIFVAAHSCRPPYPTRGSIVTIEPFQSVYVSPRRIDVWLPEGYDPAQKYAVLYMHDGQNLFDPSLSFNGQIWAADEALQTLIDRGQAKQAIIVGIWSTNQRTREFMPPEAFDNLPEVYKMQLQATLTDLPAGDRYLRFITEELKPAIDKRFSTRSDRRNTFMIGSGMGGIISIYALAQYPFVFGGAGCMSTHWPLSLESNDPGFSRPFLQYLLDNLPPPAIHKVYFDLGTEGPDRNYPVHQAMMDEVMQNLGYQHGQNWITRSFPGDAHNETSWRKRVQHPMGFLLGE